MEDTILLQLNRYPRTLDATYLETMRIIEQKDEDSRRRSYNLLRWLLYSARPLHLEELYVAVFSGVTTTNLSSVSMEDMSRTLKLSCSHLIVIDDATTLVRLRHFSVMEFLLRSQYIKRRQTVSADNFHDWQELRDSSLVHSYLAHTCIERLDYSLSQFTSTDEISHFRDRTFLDYAALYWIHHALLASPGGRRNVLLSIECFVRSDLFSRWVLVCWNLLRHRRHRGYTSIDWPALLLNMLSLDQSIKESMNQHGLSDASGEMLIEVTNIL